MADSYNTTLERRAQELPMLQLLWDWLPLEAVLVIRSIARLVGALTVKTGRGLTRSAKFCRRVAVVLRTTPVRRREAGALGKGIAASIAIAALVLAPAAARAETNRWGGSGVVTANRIGLLNFGQATLATVVRFAGRPSRGNIWDHGTYADLEYGPYGNPYVTFGFTFEKHGRYRAWYLEWFETRSTSYRSAAGTRVGTSYAQAKAREHAPYIYGCEGGRLHPRVC
jgi:hypothetical protein